MKKFIYIIATGERPELIVGCCSDLTKTAQVFTKMPTLHTSQDRLVYAEELNSEDAASERLKQVFGMNRVEKESLIESVNPQWIELLPGVNFELL
jgi:putative endonuclease